MRIEKPSMQANTPESLAIEALTFLVQNPERLDRFLALSGVCPADIRRQAGEPGFLGAILDHFMADERLLLEFAAESQRDPAEVGAARRHLAGPEWERDTA